MYFINTNIFFVSSCVPQVSFVQRCQTWTVSPGTIMLWWSRLKTWRALLEDCLDPLLSTSPSPMSMTTLQNFHRVSDPTYTQMNIYWFAPPDNQRRNLREELAQSSFSVIVRGSQTQSETFRAVPINITSVQQLMISRSCWLYCQAMENNPSPSGLH